MENFCSLGPHEEVVESPQQRQAFKFFISECCLLWVGVGQMTLRELIPLMFPRSFWVSVPQHPPERPGVPTVVQGRHRYWVAALLPKGSYTGLQPPCHLVPGGHFQLWMLLVIFGRGRSCNSFQSCFRIPPSSILPAVRIITMCLGPEWLTGNLTGDMSTFL